MKKNYLAIILSLLFAVGSGATAQTAKDYFLKMPDSFLPYLTKVNKEDMPDFIDSKMVAKVKNRFQSTTEMKQLTDDYLLIESTPSSTLQLKVLPVKEKDPILALITTVNGPVPDSRVQFFTSEWKELPAEKILSLPVAASFLLPVGTKLPVDVSVSADTVSKDLKTFELNPGTLLGDSVSRELHAYALNKLSDVNLLACRFVPGDHTLRVILTTPDYLDEKNREVVKYCLKKEPLLFRWEEGKFVSAE